jgi:hypothetical protein
MDAFRWANERLIVDGVTHGVLAQQIGVRSRSSFDVSEICNYLVETNNTQHTNWESIVATGLPVDAIVFTRMSSWINSLGLKMYVLFWMYDDLERVVVSPHIPVLEFKEMQRNPHRHIMFIDDLNFPNYHPGASAE